MYFFFPFRFKLNLSLPNHQSDKHHKEESRGSGALSQKGNGFYVRKSIYSTLCLIKNIDTWCKYINNIKLEEIL